MTLPIDDYAVLGDTGSAALVGRDGSVDWLCLPRFDSPACFAALLGDPGNGRWLLGPVGEATCSRRYVDHSAVLETTWTTDTGKVRITDLMPIRDGRADLVRRVEGLEGTVRMRHEWIVRFNYGSTRPWVRRVKIDGVEAISAIAGPDRLILRGPRLPRSADGRHVDEFDVRAGDKMTFSTTWRASHHPLASAPDFDEAIRKTLDTSQQWIDKSTYRGEYRDEVIRSLVTLRLLTHGGTGGIVAAVTTSLPEDFGGERNWDYRFCWLRDASLTLESLLTCGYREEAHLWRGWLLRGSRGRRGARGQRL